MSHEHTPLSLLSVSQESIERMLDQHLRDRPYPRFVVARMKSVRFGIVDRDRADFLGLTFAVHLVDGGGAALHLDRDTSLALLEKHGSPEALEGALCWVLDQGLGRVLRFVRVIS